MVASGMDSRRARAAPMKPRDEGHAAGHDERDGEGPRGRQLEPRAVPPRRAPSTPLDSSVCSEDEDQLGQEDAAAVGAQRAPVEVPVAAPAGGTAGRRRRGSGPPRRPGPARMPAAMSPQPGQPGEHARHQVLRAAEAQRLLQRRAATGSERQRVERLQRGCPSPMQRTGRASWPPRPSACEREMATPSSTKPTAATRTPLQTKPQR